MNGFFAFVTGAICSAAASAQCSGPFSLATSSGDYRVRPVLSGSNELLCDDLLTPTATNTTNFTYTFNTFVSRP